MPTLLMRLHPLINKVVGRAGAAVVSKLSSYSILDPVLKHNLPQPLSV